MNKLRRGILAKMATALFISACVYSLSLNHVLKTQRGITVVRYREDTKGANKAGEKFSQSSQLSQTVLTTVAAPDQLGQDKSGTVHILALIFCSVR